ncbi:hypothetical protein JCM11491_000159 [Sporobolomyces phaffii]
MASARQGGPQISYSHFVDAVHAIAGRWGSSTNFFPGWTAAEWSEDLLKKIDGAIWTSATEDDQWKVVTMLCTMPHTPDIYAGTFVSRSHLVSLDS